MSLLDDRYRLISQLGNGGFGAVWLARDERLGRWCAIKQSRAQSDSHARALETEADLLAHLSHPALPRVRDHFASAGQAYLVMEYVEGVDLAGALAESPLGLPAAKALRWALALCDALDYLHQRRPPIFHLDIKPANVKLTPDGRIVLVDFGIARRASAAPDASHAPSVTPGYSPPEQYHGRADQRSDIYALGATLYALLTGRSPATAPERLNGAPVPAPSQVRPQLPALLDYPIMQALALDPALRPPAARAFARQLQTALAGLELGASPAALIRRTGAPGRRQQRRRRDPVLWAAMLAGVAALALLAFAAL